MPSLGLEGSAAPELQMGDFGWLGAAVLRRDIVSTACLPLSGSSNLKA